ncbi:MAG: hypothetical protein H6668_04300 [Ardenticatenaceae bacterium]|nr:hypothetical protein [Ardenticatenaceae bacterium]
MNKNRRTGLIIAITSLFMIIVISYYMLHLFRSSPKSTYNFLQDDICKVSCWENIVAGQDSELDALKALIREKLINDSANYVRSDWLHLFTKEGDEVSIFFLDEKVQRIDFKPKSVLLLSTLIDKLGEPEKVYVNIEGEHEVCHVSYLYYPKDGLRIKAGSCEDFARVSRFEEGNILPGTPILELGFVEVAANAEIMVQSFGITNSNSMIDWYGYGYYAP